jgi:hypothetical protein
MEAGNLLRGKDLHTCGSGGLVDEIGIALYDRHGEPERHALAVGRAVVLELKVSTVRLNYFSRDI